MAITGISVRGSTTMDESEYVATYQLNRPLSPRAAAKFDAALAKIGMRGWIPLAFDPAGLARSVGVITCKPIPPAPRGNYRGTCPI